jgi:hypothetical protein
LVYASNRWNLLNPVSIAPSRTYSAELTVLVREHSSTPATSATTFFHVAAPNKSRNGRSKRSTSLPPLSVSRHRAAQLARCLLDVLARLSAFGTTFLLSHLQNHANGVIFSFLLM